MFSFNYLTTSAQVTETENLSPKIRRIRISGPSIKLNPFETRNEVIVSRVEEIGCIAPFVDELETNRSSIEDINLLKALQLF